MSDNIKTKDRLDADLDISAKDMGGGVQLPRNILTDPAGNDLTPLEEGGTVALDAATLAALEPPAAIVGFATASNQTSGDQVTRLSGSAAQAAVGIVAKAEPFGGLQVSGALAPLFSDAFDAALDTVNRWATSGTQTPVASGGSAVASLPASNSVSCALVSLPLFTPVGQAILVAGQLAIGAEQANPNAHRWFGHGNVTSFTSATPMTNGHGFEDDLTGAINAVVYVSGVRYVVNSTNPALITAPGSWAAGMTMSNFGQTLTYPASGVAIVSYRYFNGFCYFYMANAATGLDVPIGVASWIPAATALPFRFASITTPAVSTVLATTFALSGFIVGAIGGTNFTISDPTSPWRQAAVAITKPLSQDGGLVVHQAPSDIFRSSFADAYTGDVDPADLLLRKTGTGMAVNQTGGNLVITSGTTANSETLIRSQRSFRGALSLRQKTTLSQRIADNNFSVELADLVGELLAYTINSATSVTVTFPEVNPFTSINVGQSVNIGVIAGAAGRAGRFAIASVSGLTVTFTVASWPASGSGTLTLWGWNYLRTLYTGVTATNVAFDTQRRGWNSGDTTLTTLTSASPGHIACIQTDNAFVDYSDSLVASAGAPAFTSRGSRLENIPNDNIPLYMFIRALNGTTNPASTTTWTVGLIQVEQTGNHKVYVAGAQNNSANRAISITGPVSISSGTVTTLTTLANGQTAHSSASTGSPIRIGGRVKTANDTTLVAGDASDIAVTTDGAQVSKPYAVPDLDWQYAAASGGIVNTSDVAIKAAAGAGLRNYVTGLSVTNASATVSTEVVVKDGSTVIWRGFVGTGTLLNSSVGLTFPTPLKGTVATAMNAACITTGAAVYVNAQGYVAP